MEGRGGAGVCLNADARSLWVVAGFCGRPVSDVWEFTLEDQVWTERPEFSLAVPRSIYAGPVGGTTFPFFCFGGELENNTGHEQSDVYSADTLMLESSGSRVIATDGPAPSARGWTFGCRIEYAGQSCLALFGGIRAGDPKRFEPAAVRLGDLHILAPSE